MLQQTRYKIAFNINVVCEYELTSCVVETYSHERWRHVWEKWRNYRILARSKTGREKDPRERKVLRRWWTGLWGTSRLWQPIWSDRRYLRLRFKI